MSPPSRPPKKVGRRRPVADPGTPGDGRSGPVLVLSQETREAAEAALAPSPAMMEVLRHARAVHAARQDTRRTRDEDELQKGLRALRAAEEELGATLDRLTGRRGTTAG